MFIWAMIDIDGNQRVLAEKSGVGLAPRIDQRKKWY